MLVIQSFFLLRSLTLSTASPSCHLQESTRQIDSEGMTAKLCVFEDTGTSWMSDACPQTPTQIAASRRSVFVSRDALPLSSGWHAMLMRVFLDFPIKRDERVDVSEAGGFISPVIVYVCVHLP